MSQKYQSSPRVAILYIATGRYTVFWEPFFRSAECFLLPDCNKHYFLFTDSIKPLYGEIGYDKNPNSPITRIKQENLGWPFNTLKRFEMFLKAEKALMEFDFIFFFNGNTEFLQPVSQKDILPLLPNQNLTLTLQPHMFHMHKYKFTYERNPDSTAYIPYQSGKYYFTGALNGGKSRAFLAMCRRLKQATDEDLSNNIIAVWHDESHLNRYALDRNDVKILPPYFTRGESEFWKRSAKLMFSDKTHYRFGGHAYLRGESEQKISKEQWENENGKSKTFKALRRQYRFRIKQFIRSVFISLHTHSNR